MGRTARAPWAEVVISPDDLARDDERVQVITSPRSERPPLGAVFVGLAVGAFLLLGGLLLAWVAFATPILTAMIPTVVRPTPAELAIGGLVWGSTLVAPPCFAIVGALRIGRVARAVTAKPAPRAMTRVAESIGDEYTAARNVRLPDGRVVRDLVLGPFGLAVISELPPARMTRYTGISWEIRRSDGRWHHFENPLERATRDGERVRRWIADTERDYVVKVYAAVVTSDSTLARTPGCAVLMPEHIPAWLASLPPARSMTPDRREDLIEAIRAVA